MSSEGEAPRRGTLVLIVGPSGVGKDALIAWCRARLGATDTVAFPRRVITRAATDGSEDHDTVSEPEFDALAASGAFALHWRAHGLGYGIAAGVADDLAAGRNVVVNVSRAVVDEARRRFPSIRVVAITAPAEVLAARLGRRNREAPADIARRLARAEACTPTGPDVVTLDNAGAIEEAGARLLAIVSA